MVVEFKFWGTILTSQNCTELRVIPPQVHVAHTFPFARASADKMWYLGNNNLMLTDWIVVEGTMSGHDSEHAILVCRCHDYCIV